MSDVLIPAPDIPNCQPSHESSTCCIAAPRPKLISWIRWTNWVNNRIVFSITRFLIYLSDSSRWKKWGTQYLCLIILLMCIWIFHFFIRALPILLFPGQFQSRDRVILSHRSEWSLNASDCHIWTESTCGRINSTKGQRDNGNRWAAIGPLLSLQTTRDEEIRCGISKYCRSSLCYN